MLARLKEELSSVVVSAGYRRFGDGTDMLESSLVAVWCGNSLTG